MKEFTEIYQEVYKNSSEELKILKSKNRIRHMVLFFLMVIAVVIGYTVWKYAFYIAFGILFVLVLAMYKNLKEYTKVYKQKVIKEFIKGYSNDLEYYPERGISSIEYREAGFERNYDRYTSDDYIEGKILDSCPIKIAEVHTEREEQSTDSDGNTSTSYVTIFHGIYSEVILPEKFLKFRIEIIRNNVLGNIFKGKEKLEMDSSEFEKLYDVKTDDKIQGMRILTSDIMQMLIDFKIDNKVLPEIILEKNKLYIRYSTGAVFEPNVLKNDMDLEKLKKYYNIINFTMKLAEKFTKNIMEFEE